MLIESAWFNQAWRGKCHNVQSWHCSCVFEFEFVFAFCVLQERSLRNEKGTDALLKNVERLLIPGQYHYQETRPEMLVWGNHCSEMGSYEYANFRIPLNECSWAFSGVAIIQKTTGIPGELQD